MKMFEVDPGITGAGSRSPGFSWTNKPDGPEGSPRGLAVGPLPSPCVFGRGSGFPVGMPGPIVEVGKSHGRVPIKDFEWAPGDFWLVSEPAKTLLEELDREAFAFVAVEIVETGRKRVSSKRWLCDVVRFLDAIDEANSELHITDYGGGRRLVRTVDGKEAVFRSRSVGAAHIFRGAENSYDCYCTSAFREAVRSSGLTGLSFVSVGVLDS